MKYITLAVMCLCIAGIASAQTQSGYRVSRAATPPKIDGVLDDAAWTSVAPMPTGEWKSYNPNRGDVMPQTYRTEVRVTYDDRSLYFAFHCFDNEPEKIRTNVAKRDSAFSDDWIAISLDSAATGQAAYHLDAFRTSGVVSGSGGNSGCTW